MAVELTSDVMSALLAAATEAQPRECCGVLLGKGTRIDAMVAARNVHSSPETNFEIDPRVLVDCHRAARSSDLGVVGYYHSHPVGEPVPSMTDSTMAHRDGAIWAIIAAGSVRFWRADLAGFAPLPYVVKPR